VSYELGSTYRVEGQIKEFRHECIRAEDPRRAYVGGFGDNKGGRGEDNVDHKASDSAGRRAHSLSDSYSENLASKECDLVQDERDSADLAFDVFPAIYCSRSHAFAPNDKHESYVVRPHVDTIEEPVSKLGAVGQRERERQQCQTCDDNGSRELDAGVHGQRDNCVEHGESRAEAKRHKREEERDGPEVGTRHLLDSRGQGLEADGEAANIRYVRSWEHAYTLSVLCGDTVGFKTSANFQFHRESVSYQ
jgi:hypothetical protein